MTGAIGLAWRHASGLAELEREVRTELAAHLEALCDEHRRAGHGEAEAQRLARERFGDLDAHVEACVRERWTKERPMRTLLALMSLLLVGALLVTLSHGRALHAREEVARAQQYALMEQLAALQRAASAPTPTPVVFSIGDSLLIFDEHNLGEVDTSVRVAADGKVLLPHLGWVMVHGMERGALEAELTERYLQYFPQSKVFVAPADAVSER
jgi:hypothetical protein